MPCMLNLADFLLISGRFRCWGRH